MFFLRLSIVLLLCCTLVCGCGGDGQSASTDSIVLALNWYPEAEHGGYIAADELGLFAQKNLNVDVRPGSVGAPNQVIQELAVGRIQFAVSNADMVVLNRAAGVPLVAIAAPMQQSPRCILVHQSSGFESLSQLSDVELAINDARPFALWMKKKLPLKNVTIVPFSGSVGEFIQKKKFAQQAYVFSEPFQAQENGSDPQVLKLSDIGFNPYASVLVTTADVIRDDPQAVKAVVAASVQGWRRYLDDPVPVNRAIHEVHADMSLAALAFGADSLVELCQPSADVQFCGMTQQRWAELISQIEDIGEIERGSVKAEDCFTNQFLPEANQQVDQ